MSVITFDFVPAGRETKTSIPVTAENGSREEEFRLALGKYMAGYAASQRRRTEGIGSPAGTRFIRHNLKRFAGWLRPLRAMREVWLFSHEIGGDRRQSRS